MNNTMQGFEDLRSSKNPKARIKIKKGHFATENSHLDTYIDMSTVKTRHHNAQQAAKVLADEYMNNTFVNTILCLDEMEVVGTFLAEELADFNNYSLSKDNNISVITPEYTTFGQILVRDNKQRMIKGQQVLILAASVTTGKTIKRAIDESIKEQDEVTLPGMGVFFEILWNDSNEDEKKKILEKLKNRFKNKNNN